MSQSRAGKEVSEEIQARKYGCKLPVTLDGIRTDAIIDSGNTWRSAISEEMALRLGYSRNSLHPLSMNELDSAADDQKLTLLGETPLPVLLRVRQTSLELQPIVIKGLRADLNISGPLCQILGWSIDTANNQIVDREGFAFKLHPSQKQSLQAINLKKVNAWAYAGPGAEAMYVAQRTTVPPMSLTKVQLKSSSEKPQAGPKILKGCDSIEEKLDLTVTRTALVELPPSGKLETFVLNTLDRPITIPLGCRYGSVIPCSPMEPPTDKQIAAVDKPSSIRKLRRDMILDPAYITEAEAALSRATTAKERKAKKADLERRQKRLNLFKQIEEINEKISKLALQDLERAAKEPLTEQAKLETDLLIEQKTKRLVFLRQQREAVEKELAALSTEAAEAKKPIEKLTKKQASSFTDEQKLAWIRNSFGFNDEDSTIVSREQEAMAANLLLKHWDVFSHDGTFGSTDLLQHTIKLVPGAEPVKQKFRPLPPPLEDELRKQLDQWLAEGVIEPSDSPWASNLVPVKKKNGQVRFCIDYRQVNALTVADSFPMPLVRESLDRLAGSEIFSSIDLFSAFNSITVDKKSRPITAFSTPFGLFQFLRLGFGLSNGPATYCRLTQMVLKGIPLSWAIPFLDDVIVHAASFKAHCKHLDACLTAYAKAGLKLGIEKCSFFKRSCVFLGHKIDKDGLQPTESYKAAVERICLPTTKTEARAFIGVINYYSSSIKDFAARAAPWTNVTGKTTKEEERKPLKITLEMVKAFDDLKQALVSAPTLGYPYFSGEKAGMFTLDTDFRAGQIGACLSQDQLGKEVVIAYGSHKLKGSQASYASTRGELFAGVYYLKKFAFFLKYGKPFRWRTDNIALRNWRTMKDPPDTIVRWLETLAEFPVIVEHRAGVLHANADGLSRLQRPLDITSKEMEHFSIQEIKKSPLLGYDKGDLARLQDEDEDLKVIKEWVKNKQLGSAKQIKALSLKGRAYAREFDQLLLGRDNILRIRKLDDSETQVRKPMCAPKALYEPLVQAAHEQGGHLAVDKTISVLSRFAFFPRMRAIVHDTLTFCLPCQQKYGKPKDQRHTLASNVTGYPFEQINIDYVGPLSKTSEGNKYILTVKDSFTRWLEAFPTKDQKAETTIRLLESNIFCRFGVPEQIHSDDAAIFKSNLYKAFTGLYNIKVTTTTPYNPKSNPVERSHRELGKTLRAMAADMNQSWQEALPQAVFALNTTTAVATGIAPYQLLFGRDPATPLDVLFGAPERPPAGSAPAATYTRDLRQRIDAAQEYARANMATAISRQRRQYNKDKQHFKPLNLVWLFTPVSDPALPRKLQNYWSGPWVIAHNINDTMLRIVAHASWSKSDRAAVVSVDRVKPYKAWGIKPIDLSKIPLLGDEHAEGPFGSQNPLLPQKRKASDDSDDEDEEAHMPPPQPPPPPQQPNQPRRAAGRQRQQPPPPPPPPPQQQPQPDQNQDRMDTVLTEEQMAFLRDQQGDLLRAHYEHEQRLAREQVAAREREYRAQEQAAQAAREERERRRQQRDEVAAAMERAMREDNTAPRGGGQTRGANHSRGGSQPRGGSRNTGIPSGSQIPRTPPRGTQIPRTPPGLGRASQTKGPPPTPPGQSPGRPQRSTLETMRAATHHMLNPHATPEELREAIGDSSASEASSVHSDWAPGDKFT